MQSRDIVNIACFTKRARHNRVNYSFLSRLEIFDPDRIGVDRTYVFHASGCYPTSHVGVLKAQQLKYSRGAEVYAQTLCVDCRKNDSLFTYIYIVLYGFLINNDYIGMPRHVESAISGLLIRKCNLGPNILKII